MPRSSFAVATVVTVVAEAVGWTGVILGQTDTIADPNLMHVLGGLASLGFAVWYAWYVTVRVLPEKDKANHEEIAKMRDDHNQRQDALIEKFSEETKFLRESHQQTVAQIMNRCPGHTLNQTQTQGRR